jgi:biopolymer transport protein ExbB
MLGAVFSPEAFAWWNDDWAFRKEIGFDLTPTGADIAGTPTDVPVLLRLSLGNFEYFGDAKPDGSDVRFLAADDKTPLKHYVERWDAQAQMAYIWVRVPQLSGGTNTDRVFMYYGNPNAVDASDRAATYDTNQALVYNFGAPADAPQDATAYKSDPSAFGAEVSSASLIASGVRFNGTQSISIPATGAVRLLPSQGVTISAWIRLEAAQAQAVVAELSGDGREVVLGIDGVAAFARYSDGVAAPVVLTQSSGELAAGQWHHLAVRVGDGRLTLFVDGNDVGGADVVPQEIGGVLTVGASATGAGAFSGELDELQVSNIVRSADWIKASVRSQAVVAPLVVYGGDTQKEGGEGYITSTLRNVTLDGWIIIGILAVMFIASIGIMIAKLLFLNRVIKGNAKFLAEFRKLQDDPAALERREGGKGSAEDDAVFEEGGNSQLLEAMSSKDTFGVSTLWRLYHHGMREVMKRLDGQTASAARVTTLTPQAIEAIRATMDASLTRMTQRLSSQMVMLTISISGGPFLGLLGTVVGVMIVFAGIAASGDVNVNAIAPGTAAALVATVAGLAVAIPCLFGYNYLNSRIKEITADMQVFIDEFVTRIAETYS